MDVMLPSRCQLAFKAFVQAINVGRVALFQSLHTERRYYVHLAELGIAFNRTLASASLLSAQSTNRNPMCSPFSERHAGRVNMSPVVTRCQQLAEFRSRLGPRAVERYRIALLADAITQAEAVATLENAAVTI